MASVIKGVVRDSRGTPVPGARAAFVSGPVPLPEISALADEQGRFTLSAPVPGDYVVAGHAEGFESGQQRVRVAGAEAEVDIRLAKVRR